MPVSVSKLVHESNGRKTYRQAVVNATALVPIAVCVHHMLVILEDVEAMETIVCGSGYSVSICS
jgi:hypothetical protein